MLVQMGLICHELVLVVRNRGMRVLEIRGVVKSESECESCVQQAFQTCLVVG